MNGIISLFKTLYVSNKRLFIIALLIIVALVAVGCSSGYATGSAPSSSYIGGGCG